MSANLPFLLIALLLLWIPRQWLRLGISLGKRRRESSAAATRREQEPWNTPEPGSTAVSFRSEFGKLRNYVDFLRGAVGSVAVMGGLNIEACLTVPENAATGTARMMLAAQLGILLVALLVQVVRFERRRVMFFAPIFFLGGLTIGVCGPKGALFAFALIWAINPLLKTPRTFLTFYSLLILGFAQLFLGVGNRLALVAFAFGYLPVLLSLMANRPLVLFTRKGVHAHVV